MCLKSYFLLSREAKYLKILSSQPHPWTWDKSQSSVHVHPLTDARNLNCSALHLWDWSWLELVWLLVITIAKIPSPELVQSNQITLVWLCYIFKKWRILFSISTHSPMKEVQKCTYMKCLSHPPKVFRNSPIVLNTSGDCTLIDIIQTTASLQLVCHW